MKAIANAAYLASAQLAKEKGPFPLFNRDQFLSSATLRALNKKVIHAVRQNGLRNALLTSIAPTGTISLYAGNVSSGIEPVFAYDYTRQVLQHDGTKIEENIVDYAVHMYRKKYGERELPEYFVNAQTLTPTDHIKMQAAAQKWIDSSISKTINCPADINFDAFKDIYMQAWDTGCKGCTTYRPNAVTGSILSVPGTEISTDTIAVVDGTDDVVPRHTDNDIVNISEPLKRPDTLMGHTYKVKWPESEHALYITVNDILQHDHRRPFEVFINSKNMEHFAWTVALTRMISAVFRRGGDVSFVVEELKAVFDPRGGAWMDGKYIPSILAAIGGVIEHHMRATGFLQNKEIGLKANQESQVVNVDKPPCSP